MLGCIVGSKKQREQIDLERFSLALHHYTSKWRTGGRYSCAPSGMHRLLLLYIHMYVCVFYQPAFLVESSSSLLLPSLVAPTYWSIEGTDQETKAGGQKGVAVSSLVLVLSSIDTHTTSGRRRAKLFGT